MTTQPTKLERRLRRSGMLVVSGLVAELISLLWNHPTAFFLFVGAGALLMAAGILLYFYALVSANEPPPEAGKPQAEGL